MGGGHGEGTTYKGFTVHQPKLWHTLTGKGMCAMMWFWVLYRAKHDGPVVLVRARGPVGEARVGIIKGFSGGILVKTSCGTCLLISV